MGTFSIPNLGGLTPNMPLYSNPLGGGAARAAGGASSLGFLGGPWGNALLSFGLPALATLFGAGGAKKRAFDQWEAMRAKVMNPNWLHGRIGEYMPLMNQLSQGQRGDILTTSNAFQNSLGRNLASTGMNRTGIGALAATAASSQAAIRLGDLASENRRQSMMLGLNDRNNLMHMLDMGPQYNDNPWLEALAAGSDNFMGYLMDRRMNQTGGGYRG